MITKINLYNQIKNLWDLIVINGLVILDKYGFHKWDESNGVDRFLKTIIIKKIDF